MDTNVDSERVLNEITSLIYQWLFGMTRDEMLVEYKNHKPVGWNYVYASEDENMRDALSVSALNCLAGAEKAATTFTKQHGMCRTVSCLAEFYTAIEPYRVPGLVVWGDSDDS